MNGDSNICPRENGQSHGVPNFWIGETFTRCKMPLKVMQNRVLIKDFLLN